MIRKPKVLIGSNQVKNLRVWSTENDSPENQGICIDFDIYGEVIEIIINKKMLKSFAQIYAK